MSPFLPSIAPAPAEIEIPSARRQARDIADSFSPSDFKDTFAAQIAAKQSARRAADADRNAYRVDEKARSASDKSEADSQNRRETNHARGNDSAQTQAERRVADAREQRQARDISKSETNTLRASGGEARNEDKATQALDGNSNDKSKNRLQAAAEADTSQTSDSQNSDTEQLAVGEAAAKKVLESDEHAQLAIPLTTLTSSEALIGSQALDGIRVDGEASLLASDTRPLASLSVSPNALSSLGTSLGALRSSVSDAPILVSDTSLQSTSQSVDAARARLGLMPAVNAAIASAVSAGEGGDNILKSDALLAEQASGLNLSKLGLSGGTSAETPTLGARLLQGQNSQNVSSDLAKTLAGQATQNTENFSAGLAKTIDAQLAAATGLSEESGTKTQSLSAFTQSSLAGVQQLNSAARVQMPVSISFGQSGWSDMVAERSAMMAAQSIKFAELQLDPPELGQLQVKVSVNQDQASVSFVAPNAQVKEALEQTMARLKELFDAQGLNLADVDVSDHSSSQSDDDESLAERGVNGAEDESMEDIGEIEGSQTLNTTYGIDHYA